MFPLLHEKYDFLLVNAKNFEDDKLNHIIEQIDISKLNNNEIKAQISELKKDKPLNFLLDGNTLIPLSEKYSSLIWNIREYLAEII